jgi:methyl-accepting chemotaxis protein
MSDSEGGSIGAVVPNAIRRTHARKLGTVFLVIVLALSAGGLYVFTQTDTVAAETNRVVAEQNQERMTFSAESQARELSRVTALLREESRLLSQSAQLQVGSCSAVDGCPSVQALMNTQLEEGRLPDSIVGMHYVALDDRTVGGPDDGGPVLLESTVPGFAGNEPNELGVPWAQPPANQRLMETLQNPDASYVSQPWTFAPEGNELTVFAVVSRVPDKQQALVVMVSARQLSSTLTPPGQDGFAAVHDGGTGKTVLSQRSAALGGQYDQFRTTDDDAFALASDGNAGYTTATVGDTEYAVGYAPVEGTDWVVESYVPREQAFAVSTSVGSFSDTVKSNILLLVGGAIFALGAMVFTVGRRTSRELATLSARAEELESGNLDADLESGRIDEFGQLYGAFDSMRTSLRDRIEEVEQAQQRTQRLNSELEATADDYSEVMQACAAGDLSARMDTDTDSDAMGTVATEFNEMMDELEATTANLRRFAAEVAAQTEQVTASVEEVRNASERVSMSTQEISEGADRQRESLDGVSEEVSELSSTIQQISASADQVAGIAEQSAEVGQEGRERAQEAIAQMNGVADEAQRAADRFEDLQAEMERVDLLNDTISDIAEQTNMLALNANIEATRNGGGGGETAGEGFSVVAEEIKELATEAREAAQEADELIDEIMQQTAETAEAVEHASVEVEDSVDTVEETARALSSVADHAEETYSGVSEVDQATERQAESAQAVLRQVREAAGISDETATEAEDVAAAAEEQVAALSTVTDSVDDLADRATRLSESLDSFDTRPPEDIAGDVDASVALDGGPLPREADADGDGDGESGD